MRIITIIFLSILSFSAVASEMAGIGLLISLPVTGICLLLSIIIAFMSTSRKGYKYIFVLVAFGLVIAAFMGSYTWKLQDDIEIYQIHLLITLLLFVPPFILKIKLKNENNKNT